MSFTAEERQRLAGLADVLIPAADGYLSASAADVGGAGLDEVLTVRPDTALGLRAVLDIAGDRDAASAVDELKRNHPDHFAVLAEFAAGAYFLNRAVLAAIGYRGQNARPIAPHPDYLDDDLLQCVIHRGPIYRPTPTGAPQS